MIIEILKHYWFHSEEIIEKNLTCLKEYPAVKFEELSVFKSPWCSSYKEEQFFMETIKELGLVSDFYLLDSLDSKHFKSC